MPLIINRIRIAARGKVAFDETLSNGINVFEGQNSSGKSTLFKIIYHGLGGTIPVRQWTDAALSCDRVFLEIKIGKSIFTISRQIVETGFPPTIVIDGALSAALVAPMDAWIEIPYSRATDKQSFSQYLFNLLQMPEAFGETGDFVTFNQFLRAHYADQESPNSTVLRHEPQWDKPSTREAIGNFLLGGTDHHISAMEAELRETEKQLAQALGAVAAGNALLGSDYEQLNSIALAEAEIKLNNEFDALEDRSLELKSRLIEPVTSADIDRSRLVELTRLVTEKKAQLADAEREMVQIELQAGDSADFIRSLRQRTGALVQAIHAADQLGTLHFDACPACGVPIVEEPEADHCHLCHSPSSENHSSDRFISLLNSTNSQIEQSERIQKIREEKLAGIQRKIREINRSIDITMIDIDSQKAVFSSKVQAELTEVQNRMGFIGGEKERIRRDKKVVQKLEDLREGRDRLSSSAAALKESLDIARNSALLRLGSALSAVGGEAEKILDADLDRQSEFHNEPRVEIDYRSNVFSISGKTSFSASSTSYARNSIFMGEMFAANWLKTMRHLQFLMLENLEDKGMEPARYYRLHETIVRRTQALNGDWQILLATADLSPAVRSDVKFVGHYFTQEKMTLNL
ncbi:hypothetical protein EDF58_1011484 [Novosphingobium sp. PhB57]|uniref:hypothetical protein n=1 Tax=Novosphingobium sp. PhB57 TaxID=2485107 RepID=UPI00104A4812|nr:hypothetical protein [Novosphingobium sp. PhB57]TCU62150.1 hypothetical protein EDF58_1011484 [Novosphingobium sp. PhB57]